MNTTTIRQPIFQFTSGIVYIYRPWIKEYKLHPAIVLSYLAQHGETEKKVLRKAIKFKPLKLDSAIRQLLGRGAISRKIYSKKEIYLDILLDVPEEHLIRCQEEELRLRGAQS